MTRNDQCLLLAHARASLAKAIGATHTEPAIPFAHFSAEPCAAFVTWRERTGALRGCIGTFNPPGDVLTTVAKMAVAAGTQDPRFHSVKQDELRELALEISLLSSPQPISPDDVVVGKHGLKIKLISRIGVLLPQVPVEQRWDRETFLVQTALKAGLQPDAWQHPEVILEAFTAEVFSESPHP